MYFLSATGSDSVPKENNTVSIGGHNFSVKG